MSEMIYRVAEVLAKIERSPRPGDYLIHAKAVIKAMEEPTEGMKKAVTDQPACLECGYDVYNSRPERPWKAMIDAALEEGE